MVFVLCRGRYARIHKEVLLVSDRFEVSGWDIYIFIENQKKKEIILVHILWQKIVEKRIFSFDYHLYKGIYSFPPCSCFLLIQIYREPVLCPACVLRAWRQRRHVPNTGAYSIGLRLRRACPCDLITTSGLAEHAKPSDI
jgi:hypothetical protein